MNISPHLIRKTGLLVLLRTIVLGGAFNGTENNGGAVCGTPGASCSSGDWRQAYANYLTQYARDYVSAGVPLTDIGAFNELNYTTSYSSMSMTPAQTADMTRFLKPTLTAAGLNPQVVCCDPTGWPSAQSYTSAITSNSSINSTVDIFSSHDGREKE